MTGWLSWFDNGTNLVHKGKTALALPTPPTFAATTGFDTSLSGWVGGPNTSAAQTDTPTQAGSGSAEIRSLAPGDISLTTGANYVTVTAGTAYAFTAWFATSGTARASEAAIDWYNASSVLISTTVSESDPSTTSFTARTAVGTAPVGATKAKLRATVRSTGSSGATHYVDSTSFGTTILDPTPDFILRVHKPWASTFVDGNGRQNVKVGAGVLRALPTTIVNSGDFVPGGTWSGDMLSMTADLRDYIVVGRVRANAPNIVIENNIVTGDPTRPPTAAVPLIDTSNTTGTTVRYNTVKPSFASNWFIGIGRRNAVIEFNDVSGVNDAFSPALGNNVANVQLTIRGNYVHELAFYSPSPNHAATPTTQFGGTPLDPANPYYGKSWSHDDCCQIETDSTTGINIYGNTFVGSWSTDVSMLPLPTAVGGGVLIKEVSCFMLNGGRGIIIEDNWLDKGEQCVNNADTGVTGRIWRNHFGRGMARRVSDGKYAALMVTAPGLDVGAGTANANTWDDDDTEVLVGWDS